MAIRIFVGIGKATGGIKLPVAMNHKGDLLEFVTVTKARVHDTSQGRCVEFPKGCIVAVDRGYTDYEWNKTLSNKGVYFVARLKSNATTCVIEGRAVDQSTGLTDDRIYWCDDIKTLPNSHAGCWLSRF